MKWLVALWVTASVYAADFVPFPPQPTDKVLVYVDTPAGKPAKDVFVFDHHNEFFDAKNAEKNSSMLVLDYLESGKKDFDPETAHLTTDNLGDGALSIWIFKNHKKVMTDSSLRKLLRDVTYYEDFGVFGSKMEKDESKREAVQIAQAMLNGYDELLLKAGLKTDRFSELKPESQKELMANALKVIESALNDKAYRKKGAHQFLDRRKQVALQETQTNLPALKRSVFVYEVTSDKGVFATWSAPSQRHGKPLELKLWKLPDGKTGFILAVPNGRKFPKTLKPIGKKIAEATGDAKSVSGRNALQFSFVGVSLSSQALLQLVNESLR